MLILDVCDVKDSQKFVFTTGQTGVVAVLRSIITPLDGDTSVIKLMKVCLQKTAY